MARHSLDTFAGSTRPASLPSATVRSSRGLVAKPDIAGCAARLGPHLVHGLHGISGRTPYRFKVTTVERPLTLPADGSVMLSCMHLRDILRRR
jgi:hypothetical protein